MWHTLQRFWRFFSIGFIIAFVIYLFARWDADAVILGVVISAAVGVVVAVVIFFLQRRFPEPNEQERQ
jgi:mannose/fructose/N-acetylgalactosamine-specific phosphotransferase system component IIC